MKARRMRHSRRARWRGGLGAAMALGLVVGMATTAGAAGTALARPAPAEGSAGRVALPDPVPDWPSDYGVTDQGTSGSSVVLHLRLYLAGRDHAAMVSEARAVSDPGGRRYGRYLSPASFEARYGPTAAQVAAVRAWATHASLRVTGTNDHYVAVTGTAPHVATALGTAIDSYASSGGYRWYAPTTDISLPASIGHDVTTVLGLDSFGPSSSSPSSSSPANSSPANPSSANPSSANPSSGMSRSAPSRPAAAAAPAPSCSHWWGQDERTIPKLDGRTRAPDAICGYTPQQLRRAYGVGSDSGKGATIAVVLDGHSTTMAADADTFFARHHLAGFAKGQFTQSLGRGLDTTCGPQYADLPEEPLDVETAHIIAPAAKVVYVAANCSDDQTLQEQDFLDAETRIVDRHLADVETDSFSTTEAAWTGAMAAAWTQIFEQGAVEGIGFDFDSGDGGDDSGAGVGGGTAVQFPASDPWATAVGGTTMEIGRSGRILRTLAWGDTGDQIDKAGTGYQETPPGSFLQGSTGGRSTLFAEPAYQRGVVPGKLATGGGTAAAHRVVPDISADASPMTGWLIGYRPGPRAAWEQIPEGGTSGASPTIAALEADAQAVSGRAVGFVNPLLYDERHSAGIEDVRPPSTAALAAARNCYNDPTSPAVPCVVTLGRDSGLVASAGFDDATGLGAPTTRFVATLAHALRGG